MKTMTLSAFAAFLRTVPAAVKAAERHGLERGAVLIQEEAQGLIGTEYAGWAALAQSTVARKQAKGQTGRLSSTDPLFATGEMRATIGHQIEGNVAIIGMADEVGLYQEVGTSRIPARPFLASAAYRKGEAAANAIGEAVGHALAGKPPSWRP